MKVEVRGSTCWKPLDIIVRLAEFSKMMLSTGFWKIEGMKKPTSGEWQYAYVLTLIIKKGSITMTDWEG